MLDITYGTIPKKHLTQIVKWQLHPFKAFYRGGGEAVG